MKQLLLSDREAVALNNALDLYIRLGLGQVSAIGPVLERLSEHRKIPPNHYDLITNNLLSEVELTLRETEWKLEDPETSSLTIAAFGLQAKLGENHAAWEWACKQLHDKGEME